VVVGRIMNVSKLTVCH